MLALQWLVAPLMGTFVQPYLGLCSDASRISWGRRRPYIAGGAVGLILSFLALAWTEDIVYATASTLGATHDNHDLGTAVCVIATLLLWTVIFSVQPLQAGLRALIVDSCTTEQMSGANAWASRMVGMGSILGYSTGFLDVSSWLPAADNSQMKVLGLITSTVLAITVSICCIFIKEEDPAPTDDGGSSSTPLEKISEIYRSMFRLPPQIKAICKVQLCSWFGWYCFLFFSTTYIGELYLQHEHASTDGDRTEKLKAFREAANHRGSLGLLIYSLANMATTIIAPVLIDHSTHILSSIFKLRPTSFLVKQFGTSFSGLRASWMFSELLFGLCMFSTFFVSSVNGTIILVGVVGVSAALSQQVVPFTLISIILSHSRQVTDPESGDSSDTETNRQYESRPGIVIGLHNVAIAVPQLLASLASSLIFHMNNGGSQGSDADDGNIAVGYATGTAWVMRTGGVAALLAAYMATRIDVEAGEENHVRFGDQDGTCAEAQEKGQLGDEEASGLLKDYDNPSAFDT